MSYVKFESVRNTPCASRSAAYFRPSRRRYHGFITLRYIFFQPASALMRAFGCRATIGFGTVGILRIHTSPATCLLEWALWHRAVEAVVLFL